MKFINKNSYKKVMMSKNTMKLNKLKIINLQL